MRPTGDVDIVLHIETARGVPSKATGALQELGYRMLDKVDPRENTAHRWIRVHRSTDAGAARRESGMAEDGDQVDVLSADHAAPSVVERVNGRQMVRVEGGTQALRRTVNAALDIRPGRSIVLSVPRPFAAVILKSAAYLADSRDRDRHLFDAAALLACIEDPFVEADGMVGSDRRRIRVLVDALPDAHRAWSALERDARESGQGALRVLSST